MVFKRQSMPAGSGLHLIGDTGIALGTPANGKASAVWEDVEALLDCSLAPTIRSAHQLRRLQSGNWIYAGTHVNLSLWISLNSVIMFLLPSQAPR